LECGAFPPLLFSISGFWLIVLRIPLFCSLTAQNRVCRSGNKPVVNELAERFTRKRENQKKRRKSAALQEEQACQEGADILASREGICYDQRGVESLVNHSS
jgi:hypothetical protein